MKNFALLLLFTALWCYPASTIAQQKAILKVIATFPISGDGGWDYLAIQPGTDKLFVSHGKEVNIIDKNHGDSLGCIKGLNGVHGIAFVTHLNKGYITSGRDNTVVVFDLKTHTILHKINGGLNPDGIVYDARLHKLIVSNGKSNSLSLIDPKTDKISATIDLGGRPEVALSDGKNIFVNLEDKSEIAVVDVQSGLVVKRWPLTPLEAPSGMALDIKNHRLFTACSDSEKMMVIDYSNGKTITVLPIGEDCDGLWFDKAKATIFASNKGGTVTVIKQLTANAYKVIANVKTQFGAKTITGDEGTHKIYVSTATLKKDSGSDKTTIVPGTFKVMVLGY